MDQPELETRLCGTPAPDALDRWGPFEHLQRVGRGSFGEVYRAFDPTLQRHVALKLLLPSGLNRDEEVGALLREARAIARVRHPNVVPIYGVDRHDGRLGFWSDFVNGQTLAELVTTQGAMGPREAALVGIDVCRAAGAVHAAGFLHRDIKAANVMREEGGRILLMDFGLTHEHGPAEHSSGTPAYMAPELLLGQPATISSDVYAIGVMLFYLLTKQYPVEGADFRGAPRRARIRQAAHAARRSSRSPRSARPRRRNGDQRVTREAFRQHRADDRRAVRGDRSWIFSGDRTRGREPAPSAVVDARASRDRRAALSWLFVFERRPAPPRRDSRTPVAGEQQDYRRAHDLLAHYYRPHALETAIPLLETIVAQDAHFAPAFADLGRANFLQFAQQRDTKYIEPAREASLRALAIAPDLASAHVTLGFLYAFTDRTTSPATSSKLRCVSTSSTPRRTARWRSCRLGRDAPTWSRRRCKRR